MEALLLTNIQSKIYLTQERYAEHHKKLAVAKFTLAQFRKGILLRNGEIYIGQFTQGQYCGQGICRGHSNRQHMGKFKNNHKHGFGIQRQINSIYVGEYMNNQQSGYGFLTTIQPHIQFFGIFFYDEFLKGYQIDYYSQMQIQSEGVFLNQQLICGTQKLFNNQILLSISEGLFEDEILILGIQSSPSQVRKLIDEVKFHNFCNKYGYQSFSLYQSKDSDALFDDQKRDFIKQNKLDNLQPIIKKLLKINQGIYNEDYSYKGYFKHGQLGSSFQKKTLKHDQGIYYEEILHNPPDGYDSQKNNNYQYKGDFLSSCLEGFEQNNEVRLAFIGNNKGDKYTGYTHNGIPHGFGRLQTVQGYSYEGNFSLNKRQGYGILQVDQLHKYSGYWYQDEQNGWGIVHSDRAVFKGQFKQNHLHGTGVQQEENVTYVGSFTNGQLDGTFAKLQLNNDSEDLICNMIDASLIVSKRNGQIYGAVQKGQFKQNHLHGTGVQQEENVTYVGSFTNGQLDGTFTKLQLNNDSEDLICNMIDASLIVSKRNGQVYEGVITSIGVSYFSRPQSALDYYHKMNDRLSPQSSSEFSSNYIESVAHHGSKINQHLEYSLDIYDDQEKMFSRQLKSISHFSITQESKISQEMLQSKMVDDSLYSPSISQQYPKAPQVFYNYRDQAIKLNNKLIFYYLPNAPNQAYSNTLKQNEILLGCYNDKFYLIKKGFIYYGDFINQSDGFQTLITKVETKYLGGTFGTNETLGSELMLDGSFSLGLYTPKQALTGIGSILYPQGDKYVGQWNVNKHGNYLKENCGQYHWPTAIYAGNWINGKQQLSGTIIFSNEQAQYSGEFVQGLKHGSGWYIMIKGTPYKLEGIWDKDQFLTPFKLEGTWHQGQFLHQ